LKVANVLTIKALKWKEVNFIKNGGS